MAEDTPKVIEFRSEHSPTVIYACTWCGLTVPRNNRDAAEACCRCTRCGNKTDRHYTLCSSCKEIEDAALRESRRAAKLVLPIVEDDGGPVYVEDIDKWFHNSDEARDALVDDGIDPAAAIVHPSIVSKAGTPLLTEIVDEAWAENFEDPDPMLDDKGVEILTQAQKAIEALAPTVWNARTKERIVLAGADG